MSSDRDFDLSTISTTGDPRLPFELEQEIFLYAVRISFKNVAPLLVVSKRIREWLLLIIFKVVIAHHTTFLPFPFNRLSLFRRYGSQIHHLLISDVDSYSVRHEFIDVMSALDECLAQCPNITDLALLCHSPQFSLRSLTRFSNLTRLSIQAYRFSKILPTSIRDTQPPLFPTVTHLHLLRKIHLETSECEHYLAALGHHFPALTHLAHCQDMWPLDESFTSLSNLALRMFKTLKVFVVWRQLEGRGEAKLAVDEEFEWDVDDERFVPILMSRWMEDWHRDVRGDGEGMWTFAERVLQERKMDSRFR